MIEPTYARHTSDKPSNSTQTVLLILSGVIGTLFIVGMLYFVVPGEVGNSVGSVVDERINQTVPKIVKENVGSAVSGAVAPAIEEHVQPVVEAAVQKEAADIRQQAGSALDQILAEQDQQKRLEVPLPNKKSKGSR